MIRTRQLFLVLGLPCLWTAGCSTANNAENTSNSGGSGSAAGAVSSAGAGSAGAPTGVGGTGASASGAGGSSSAGASGAPSGGGGSSGAGAGTAGSSGGVALGGAAGGGNRTQPTCAKATPSPNDARAGECDYLLQSLDFEDQLGYTTTPDAIKVTDYGQAFGLFEINSCSPYCYGKNLTVGIDIVGGGDAAQVQGEVIVEFPKTGTGLPITVADMSRNALAWITFDGAAKPPFEIDTQLVVETATAVIPSVESKAFFKTGGTLAPFGPFDVTNNYSYDNGSEFKYFAVTSATGFPTAPTNVTGVGFRITAKATAGQEWHGVAYIDHLQIRGAGGDNPTDAGAYPYGL